MVSRDESPGTSKMVATDNEGEAFDEVHRRRIFGRGRVVS